MTFYDTLECAHILGMSSLTYIIPDSLVYLVRLLPVVTALVLLVHKEHRCVCASEVRS